MPYFKLKPLNPDLDIELYYDDEGAGQPVLFLHGMWMSSHFFTRQLAHFSTRYRTLALDFRGHGRSSQFHSGHTVATYAQDLHTFLEKLDLTNVVLVGWSMGALVMWEYLRRFGDSKIKATVVVTQGPSDFKWPDWPQGVFDLAALRKTMSDIQTDYKGYARKMLPAMFKQPPKGTVQALMLADITRLPATVAGSIFFDQSVRDYRELLPTIFTPTLLCFGNDDQSNGEYLLKHLPNARLSIFEESGHCPFYEEPDRFNREVDRFIQSLG